MKGFASLDVSLEVDDLLGFMVRRVLYMIPMLILISIVSFILIELPPGNFATRLAAELRLQGQQVDEEFVEQLIFRYGLDRPWYTRYFKWVNGFTRGNFGYSLLWNRPVEQLIGERLALSVILSLGTLIFTWIVAFPIGLYSALRPYSKFDYLFTTIGFLGLAIPNFMLALVLLYLSFLFLDVGIGGLFSRQFISAPWSLAKVFDLVQHIWIPMIVIGTAGTAGTIRILRANLLDELKKPYVVTATAKGVPWMKNVLKYPVRVALNPFISTVGWLLPGLVSGEVITSVVLNLPTSGPLFLEALLSQDMFLAVTFVMFFAALTLVGTVISDICLAWIDPRIRFEA